MNQLDSKPPLAITLFGAWLNKLLKGIWAWNLGTSWTPASIFFCQFVNKESVVYETGAFPAKTNLYHYFISFTIQFKNCYMFDLWKYLYLYKINIFGQINLFSPDFFWISGSGGLSVAASGHWCSNVYVILIGEDFLSPDC